MKITAILILSSALALIAGCAPTNVTTTQAYAGPLPPPNLIVVYDFAVSPDEVKLDSGIGSEIMNAMKGDPRTEQELKIGHETASSLSKHLVKELQGMGFVVMSAAGANPSMDGNTLLIKGQFISIDEGNRTARVVIGLGLGRTELKANVQVVETMPNGPVLVEQFLGDAKSGFKPGMAESMGAGAAVGKVGTAAAVSGGLAIGSEMFSANIDADARRMAKDLATQIKNLYNNRGWQKI